MILFPFTLSSFFRARSTALVDCDNEILEGNPDVDYDRTLSFLFYYFYHGAKHHDPYDTQGGPNVRHFRRRDGVGVGGVRRAAQA